MSRMRCFAALLCILAVVGASARAAAAEVLDRGFDADGVKLLDFESAPGVGSDDLPIANCPAPDNKQLVVLREGSTGLIATRLRFDGSVDVGFGNNGVRRLAVPMADSTFGAKTVALCRADGGIWLAGRAFLVDNETNVRLVAIDADGALVLGAFGASAGWGDIDLDIYRGDLLKEERPLGFNHRPGGGAFLTGNADTPNGRRPFLALIGADSVIDDVVFFQPAGFRGQMYASAAGVGSGGGIWVAGDGQSIAGGGSYAAFRAYLDPVSLTLARTEVYALPGEDVRTSGGGMLRSDLMVVAASRGIRGNRARPLLLVMRGDGQITSLDLPQPLPLAPGLITGINTAGAALLPLPDYRLLYAIGAEAFDGDAFLGYQGWYFARAFIGGSAAEDRVDTAFGTAGQTVLSVNSGDSSCIGKRNHQEHVRVGHWQGLPTVIGAIKRRCDPNAENDAALLRLKSVDAMFDDGFE